MRLLQMSVVLKLTSLWKNFSVAPEQLTFKDFLINLSVLEICFPMISPCLCQLQSGLLLTYSYLSSFIQDHKDSFSTCRATKMRSLDRQLWACDASCSRCCAAHCWWLSTVAGIPPCWATSRNRFCAPARQRICIVYRRQFRFTMDTVYRIRIQLGQWIRIRIRNPDPDPGGQKCAGCSLLRAEGFFCSLDVLYGGLGIGKFSFW